MAGKQQALVGRVVSDKMEKTVVVAVETRKPHPLYRRIIRTVKKFKAHNENNQARTGDLVRIVETRPLSKEKRWRVAEILTKGQMVDVPPEAIAAPAIEES